MKFSVSDAVLLGIVGVLVLVPVLQYERWGIDHLYNNKRLIQVALLIVSGGILVFSKVWKERLTFFIQLNSIQVLLAIACILIIGGISTLIAEFHDWAFLDYAHYLLIILVTFFIGAITYQDTDKAMMYLKIGVLSYILFYLARVAFFYMLHQIGGGVELWPGKLNGKALFSFSFIRFFNQTQTWTIPIIASLGFFYWNYSKRQWLRWGVSILIIGWGMLVIASGARGTVLGVVVGILVVWIMLVKDKWHFFRYHAVLAVITLFGHYVFFELLAGGTEKTLQRAGSTGRFHKWIELIYEILEKPFWGYGPMHYASVVLDNAWGHPHNWLLQFGYEWGIFVAVLLLILFIFGLYQFGKQLKFDSQDTQYYQQNYWFKLGLYWSMLAAFIHGFFSGLVVMPLSQTWFVLIVGVSMGLYFDSLDLNKNLNKNFSKYGQTILTLLVILAFTGFINWVNHNPINRKQIDSYYYKEKESVSSRSYPRYWQQGKIGFQRFEGPVDMNE